MLTSDALKKKQRRQQQQHRKKQGKLARGPKTNEKRVLKQKTSPSQIPKIGHHLQNVAVVLKKGVDPSLTAKQNELFKTTTSLGLKRDFKGVAHNRRGGAVRGVSFSVTVDFPPGI